MNPGAFAQCFESLLIGESRVRRCQPEATPQVGLAFSRKCLDGADNKLRIPSIDEPEGTAQALVENTFSVTLNPGRPARLRVNVFGPMEKTLVKPPAIERQPAQQRVQPPSSSLHPRRHPRPNPADRDVDHVRVGIARTAEESLQPRRSPGREPIQ